MNDQCNCPFYGYSLAGRPNRATVVSSLVSLVFLPTFGNQCALEFTAHSPCGQEMVGRPVDWRVCPMVKEIREGIIDAH